MLYYIVFIYIYYVTQIYHIILNDIESYYITLRYITLHHIISYYLILQYIYIASYIVYCVACSTHLGYRASDPYPTPGPALVMALIFRPSSAAVQRRRSIAHAAAAGLEAAQGYVVTCFAGHGSTNGPTNGWS